MHMHTCVNLGIFIFYTTTKDPCARGKYPNTAGPCKRDKCMTVTRATLVGRTTLGRDRKRAAMATLCIALLTLVYWHGNDIEVRCMLIFSSVTIFSPLFFCCYFVLLFYLLLLCFAFYRAKGERHGQPAPAPASPPRAAPVLHLHLHLHLKHSGNLARLT